MFCLKSLVAGGKDWCSLGTLVSKSLSGWGAGAGKTLLNPDILPPPQHKVVRFFSCSKRSALQCVHLCDMAPNECTTNPSTSSAVWRACFLARQARAPRLAACHSLASWAALAARMAEACRSLIVCCYSASWAALAACMVEACHSLTACCCLAGWATLAAHMAEACRFLTACCCSAGWATLAARLIEASRSFTTYCCSTSRAALAARMAKTCHFLTAYCCSALCIIHKVREPWHT
jgi:hypothetical protein